MHKDAGSAGYHYVLEVLSLCTYKRMVACARLENIVGKTVNKEKLVQKLSEAEKIGLLKREIANGQDELVQTWSTQCSV